MTHSQPMAHPNARPNRIFIILLLGGLSVVTPFAIDMYLPAFPRIADDLKTPISSVALTVSAYFIGFALGQILYGPLLDRFGRKRPLYFGLAVYILGCVGCLTARDIETLIAFRFVQAVGGCVAPVAAVAMVRDFFPAEESAKIFSLLFLIIGVSPLLAPTVGSVTMLWLGWHWIFALLGGIATVILLLTIFLLPEGHEPDATISLKPGHILSNFGAIFKEPQFYTYAFAGAFSLAGLFSYVAGSPIIFMDGFHVSPKGFGAIFATLTMGFVGGNQLNVLMLRKFNSEQLFLWATVAQVTVGLVFAAGMWGGRFGLTATLILFFVFLGCIGLTCANATAIALAPFSKNVGSASALLGSLQMGIGAVISTGIGLLHAGSGSSIVSLLAASAVIALLILMGGRGKIIRKTSREGGETAEAER